MWIFLIFMAQTVFAVDLEEIVRQADAVRNPSESYSMEVEVRSGQKLDELAKFQVALKGNTRTLVKTLEPARDRGRNLLMIGEDMWAYVPNLKRAVRVSLSQKLTGQTANGDISRMRWSGDYTAALEKESPDHWQLFLKSRRKGLTYDQLRVWIDKKTYRPLRAEFLTPQGKVLKLAEYGDYKMRLGKIRPHLIRIADAVRKDDRSEIRITDMQNKSFPDSTFNQNALE